MDLNYQECLNENREVRAALVVEKINSGLQITKRVEAAGVFERILLE